MDAANVSPMPCSSTRADFCKRHKISRATFWREVKRKNLKVYKIGAAVRVLDTAEREWLAVKVAA